ncbi:hypothetical protein Gpo141_00008820 [Globisporangium polare]
MPLRRTRIAPAITTRKKTTKRAVPRLQPDDFDDVQYKVEMVRTTTAGASDGDDDNEATFSRDELLEIAFVASLFVVVVGGCVAIGLKGDVLLFSQGALKHVLPILLVPIAWVLALHLWEKQQQRRQQQFGSEPHAAIPDAHMRSSTKVATF